MLTGNPVVEIDRCEEWVEPGVTAFDTNEGDLSGSVVMNGSVDTQTVGRYVLTYSVENAAGEKVTKERSVFVRYNREDIEGFEAAGKVIYMTFDDGPSNYTLKLLSILEKYNVKATFFLCNTARLEYAKQELEAGHTIAAHTNSHDYSIYKSDVAYFDDLNKIRKHIFDKTGYMPTMLRFPGGSSNTVSRQYRKGAMTTLTGLVEEAGYIYQDWNVSSGDAGKTKDSKEVAQNVIKGVKGQKVAVVLCHDIHSYTVEAIEEILVWGLENGYTFLPLTKYSRIVHHGINN